MNRNTSPEVLNSCSGNLKSKECPELSRRIENLKLDDSAECPDAGGQGDSVKKA
jgi:hypothetical protein